MSMFKDENRRLNETLFEDFIALRKEGEQALKAQLEVNKARINLTVAKKELEYESALLKKYEMAKESINPGKVKLREKLGLNLNEKMKNLGGKALVTVEKLVFSVAMSTSSTKTRLTLTAYVKTFEGSNKAINFPMDFNTASDSLTSASRRIVEKLFGTSHSRKRRSAGQMLLSSKTNDNTNSLLEGKKCVFARESNLFFADILGSLLFAIQSQRNFEETMTTGLKSLDNLLAVKDNLTYFSSGPQQQIRRSLSDIVQSIKDVQLNSSGTGSWNDTLDDLRAFLDILSWEKNFTECSGVQDCSDYFFDHLGELYEMEYHPRAIEIKTMLQLLERLISSMIKENHRISTLEGMVSQAKLLVNKSRDDFILCGKKPEIEKNSPLHVTAISGESFSLVCEAKSKLKVEYLWIRNGQPLEENNSTVLELQNVTKQSAGAYKCQASNRRGSVVSNVTIVEVHQRPSITEQPRDAQVLVGEQQYIMICNSTGVPHPSTEWFFIPMKAEKHEVVHVNITTPYLTLSNLKIANSGFYYCNASNLHGTVLSRVARLDILRFVSGVPRMAVRLNLKQCMSAASPENYMSYCQDKTSRKYQHVDVAALEYLTQKMLERVNWPVERVNSKQCDPFPNAVISFVVNGDISPVSEGKKLDLLYRFSLSRQRMGNSLKKLYFALQEEGMKLNQNNLTISGDAESLAFRLLPQLCPNGTRRHENGFLCVFCPPGSYGVANGTCLQCPVGTYQPDEGSTECVKCPPRLPYTEIGAMREYQCADISIPCKPPEVSTKHAKVPEDMKSLYRHGETVVFGCEPGYRLVGNGSRECNEGNWTTTDFYCEKTCFPPWNELKKRCYLVMESPTRGWKDALVKCQNLGSHLVTISSEEENKFIGQLAKVYLEEKKLGQLQMWLGLRRLHAKDHFQWVDGSSLESYTNWAPDEPNNANGRELCSEMLVSGTFWLNKWNDVDCSSWSYRSIVVCEKPLREGD